MYVNFGCIVAEIACTWDVIIPVIKTASWKTWPKDVQIKEAVHRWLRTKESKFKNASKKLNLDNIDKVSALSSLPSVAKNNPAISLDPVQQSSIATTSSVGNDCSINTESTVEDRPPTILVELSAEDEILLQSIEFGKTVQLPKE